MRRSLGTLRRLRSAESLSPGGLCAIQLVDGSGVRLSGGVAPGVPAGWREACEGLPLSHMGRGPDDDPAFFAAAFAAGKLARELLG